MSHWHRRRLLAAAFQAGRCGIPFRSFLVLHTSARQFFLSAPSISQQGRFLELQPSAFSVGRRHHHGVHRSSPMEVAEAYRSSSRLEFETEDEQCGRYKEMEARQSRSLFKPELLKIKYLQVSEGLLAALLGSALIGYVLIAAVLLPW